MSILREIESVRRNAGLWIRGGHTVLRFTGKDALSWLHAQVTNDIARLETGAGCMAALLDRKGHVQAFFSAHRWEDECWLLIESAQADAVRQRIDSHLFLEDVSFEDAGADSPQIMVEGPRAPLFLARILEATPDQAAALLPEEPFRVSPLELLGHQVLAFRVTESAEDGYCLVPGPGECEPLFAALEERADEHLVHRVSPAARAALRAEALHTPFGVDIDADCIISETPLEASAVSYEKGCYLGQEVVARLKAYGSPKRALVGLLVRPDATDLPEGRQPLFVDGQKVGETRNTVFAPTLGQWLVTAYLDREHRTAGASWDFTCGEIAFQGTIAHPPFIEAPPRRVRAEARYHQALEYFEQDANDEDDTAIRLLEDALLLAPAYEDACEALGVILHRHQRTDEAIACMQRLAKLNPDCIMAHTNLSVFYVAKGMIQEAEAEKAIASQLEMKHKLDARAAERIAAEERQRIEQEARTRIGMFKEVLEIDPEDPVATMGLGSAYIQLGEYGKAVAPLETATRVKKDYSAAFLNLGKCHEFLDHPREAVRVYREGIQVASRKGDLMPLREMERRLNALERARP